MLEINYNPDVLSCLANLSNDEVFTPPELANEILDQLPDNLWSDSSATFLDPVSKSGIFLREIAKRLIEGLKDEFPDEQERINHILKNQLFGIAITELTALLARRSVYCSKNADGPFSVCTEFEGPEGNIRFTQTRHTFNNGRCVFCGASQDAYEREDGLETHAYEFIHTDNPKGIFNMKFDVIIGNPPYQMGADGGTRDVPIYNKFIEQAKKLNPRFLSMIIPSRWMASGLGLTEFRRTMLNDKRIRKLVDYERMGDVFPGVDFEGGVCYFLWERDNPGDCALTSVNSHETIGPVDRDLSEHDILVRDSRAISILHKIQAVEEDSIIDILSADKEFGWTSNFDGFHKTEKAGDVPFYYNRQGKRLVGFINRSDVTKSPELIDTWKVMVPAAYGERGAIPAMVLGPTFIAPSPSVCTQTYLFFSVGSKSEAESLTSYLRTKMFRFLVSLRKITQHATRSTYTWVPIQDWSCTWTDADLYEKYGLTEEERAYIEGRVRPIETQQIEIIAKDARTTVDV